MTTSFSIAFTGPNSSAALGGANSTIVLTLASADLAVADGTAVRVTLACPPSGSPITLNDVFIGHQASSGNAYNFDGNQQRVTFGGSNSVTLAVGGANVVSDFVSFNLDHTKNLTVAYDYTTAGDVARMHPTGITPTMPVYYFNGSNATDAGTTLKSGYSGPAGDFWDTVAEIEVFTGVTGTMGPTEATDTFAGTGAAPPAPPNVDATFGELTGHGHSITSPLTFSFSGTNKTAGANEYVLCCIGHNLRAGSGIAVSSVTVTGLTFVHLYTIEDTTSGAFNNTIEVWGAPASSAFNSGGANLTYTIDWSGGTFVDGVVATVFAVQGLDTLVAPFDPDASLAASAFNATSTTPPTVTFNTTQEHDLLIALSINFNPFGTNEFPTAPAGWTGIAGPSDNTGLHGIAMRVNTKNAVTAQTSATFQDAATGSSVGWTALVFAMTADPPAPVTGTIGATEAKDIFAGTGLGPPPIGTMGATEAKDIFSGYQAPPLGFDGYAVGGNGGGSGGLTSGTVTLSTSQDNELICVYVVTGGHFNAGQVTSITDIADLVWHRRHKRTQNGSEPFIELWWAHAPTPLSADVITVNTDATGALAVIAFGVTGANTTTPWDTNSRAPWFYDVTGGNPTTSLYTNAASTMLLALYGADGVGTAGTIDAGFTYVTQTSQSEHVGDTMVADLAYQIVSAAQSNLQAQYGQSGGTFNKRSIMTDAIVAAGETGTADEVYWYFDQGSGADIVISASSDNQTASVTGVSFLNPDLMTIVMVMIQSASGLGTVTSINDSNNLAPASPGFQRRSRKTDSTGTLALEVWWAYTPNALNSNDTINVLTTETAPGDVISVIVFGVGGTSGSIALGDPFWDGATDLPALADTDSGGGIGVYPNTTITSTITQNCLLLGFTANTTVDETGGATLPFYPFESTASAGPAANLAIEFLYSSALVSDQLVEFDTSPSPHTWVMIADAIPVGLPVPPNGVWGSTEAKDTLTHTGDFSEIGIDGTAGWVGYPAGTGVIVATEAKDKFTGAPAQAPYDSVGWLGWVPAFATMAAVDTKDHASLGGWVIGAGGISGRWTSTDAPDRWSLSNIGPAVTGTMHPVELTDRWASAGFILPVVPPPTPRKRRLLIIT